MGVRLNGCPTLWSAAKIRDAGNDAYVYHFAYHPDKPRGYDGAGTGDWAGLACHGANAHRNSRPLLLDLLLWLRGCLERSWTEGVRVPGA